TWLTAPDLATLRADVTEFIARLDELRAATSALARDIGPRWDDLPEGIRTEPSPEETELAELATEGLDLAGLTEEWLRGLVVDFREVAETLRNTRASLGDVAAVYGMPAPETFEQAFALCRLTEFARWQHRPEAAWLTGDGRAAAARAAAELESRVNALTQARAVAGQTFTEGILDVPDFPALVRRFGETHGLGKLSGAHRADKRLLAGLTVSGGWTKEAAERLPQALAWYEAAAALQQAATAHARVLGRYWHGEHTDFQLVRRLLEGAEEIGRLTEGVQIPSALAEQVSADGHPDTGACAAADRAREQLDGWRRKLVPAPRPGGRPRLATGTLADTAAWYSAHLGPLTAAAELTAKVRPILETPASLTLEQA